MIGKRDVVFQMFAVAFWIVIAAVVVSSCGVPDRNLSVQGAPGTAGSSSSSNDAIQGCKNAADAFAKAGDRCDSSLTYSEHYKVFELTMVNGSCDNVTALNDPKALGTCINWFNTMSCTDWNNANYFDVSCVDLFVY